MSSRYGDQMRTCVDCERALTWTAGEQEFFHEKGFIDPPKRCKECRQAKKAQREVRGQCGDPERGSIENANGLIRQYLRKGISMAGLSQQQCNASARKLNTRPRKQLGFKTPLECYYEA